MVLRKAQVASHIHLNPRGRGGPPERKSHRHSWVNHRERLPMMAAGQKKTPVIISSMALFPPPLTLLPCCCGTYLQGSNGVDVHGDSTALTRVAVQSCGLLRFMPNPEHADCFFE